MYASSSDVLNHWLLLLILTDCMSVFVFVVVGDSVVPGLFSVVHSISIQGIFFYLARLLYIISGRIFLFWYEKSVWSDSVVSLLYWRNSCPLWWIPIININLNDFGRLPENSKGMHVEVTLPRWGSCRNKFWFPWFYFYGCETFWNVDQGVLACLMWTSSICLEILVLLS